MAILCISTLPPEVTLDHVRAVSAEIGADGPPEGSLSYVVVVDGGQVKSFHVWESQEAMETFNRDRLVPAVRKLMGDSDPGQLPQPEVQIFEAHDVMVAP
jgi:quinol monooxygenase YgiN